MNIEEIVYFLLMFYSKQIVTNVQLLIVTKQAKIKHLGLS